MSRWCDFTGDMDGTTRLCIGFIDNVVIPILLHQFLDGACSHPEMQYYLCHLYRHRDEPGNREKLSRAIHNMIGEDNLLEIRQLRVIPAVPWSKETLSQAMRLTGFQFKKFSHMPIYREYTLGQAVASTIYSSVQYARYWFIRYGVINVMQTTMQLLLLPARLISSPVTPAGTLTIPFVINGAFAEELIFRYLLQGCLLTALPNAVLSKLQIDLGSLIIPMALLRVIFQAILFSAQHIYNQFADLKRFMGALVYGGLYEITGNLFSSTIAHCAWNMKVNYEAVTRGRAETETALLSYLDPTALMDERYFLKTRKANFISLALCVLARYLLCNTAEQGYQNLWSSITVLLLSFATLQLWLFKTGNQRHHAAPDCIHLPTGVNRHQLFQLSNQIETAQHDQHHRLLRNTA